MLAEQVILGRVDQWFDPSAFTLPEEGYLGNLGRNTYLGPGLVSMDATPQKYIWRTERHSLRLRLEVSNVANHPNFKVPNNDELDIWDDEDSRLPAVGRLTATSTTSRQIQIGIRFSF